MALWKATNADIEVELRRHTKAQALIAEGKLEEARRLWWWPKNEDPPSKSHWSQVGMHSCSCGKHVAEGSYGFCGYCQGATSFTPSIIKRK